MNFTQMPKLKKGRRRWYKRKRKVLADVTNIKSKNEHHVDEIPTRSEAQLSSLSLHAECEQNSGFERIK